MQKDIKTQVKAPKIDFTYTPTQLNKWKQDHQEIHQIDVIVENDELIRGIFKKPSLEIIQAADAMSGEDDVLKRSVFAFDNCFIAGDARLQLEDDLKVSAGIQVYKLFQIRAAVITKL